MDQPAGTRQPSRQLTIGESHAGQRIDNFLMSSLRGVPRARIYRILRKGEVRVNRGRIRQDYRLRPGDVVRIPPLALDAPVPARGPAEALLRRVDAAIAYEDEGLLVVDKPSGVSVHAGSGCPFGVIEALRGLRPRAAFLELAHRLDRETSGCLLIAKRREVLTGLHAQMRAGDVDKRYLLLVAGRWRGGPAEAAMPLRRNVARGGERLVQADAAGRPAVTAFAPVESTADASLLLARTLTGRTHQIRVHAAALGHPLAGDRKYGERGFNRRMRQVGLSRLFLHASSVAFVDPATGSPLRIEVPLEEDLAAVLDRLGLRASRPRPGRGTASGRGT